jgi:hypothetical protein
LRQFRDLFIGFINYLSFSELDIPVEDAIPNLLFHLIELLKVSLLDHHKLFRNFSLTQVYHEFLHLLTVRLTLIEFL